MVCAGDYGDYNIRLSLAATINSQRDHGVRGESGWHLESVAFIL